MGATPGTYSPTSGASVSGPSQTISIPWTYTGAGGMVTSLVGYRVSGGAWAYDTKHFTSAASYTHNLALTLAQGDRVDWYAAVKGYDGASYTWYFSGSDSSPHYFTVATDSTGPTISGRQPADAYSGSPVYTAGVRFRATASDAWGVTSTKLYVDGGLITTVASGTLDYYHPLNKGAHTWYVIATDTNGNSTTSSTYSLTITNVAPNAPIGLYVGASPVASATTRVSASARLTWTASTDLNPEDSITYAVAVAYNGGGYTTLTTGLTTCAYDWAPTTQGTAALRITPNDGTADGSTLDGSCTVTTGTAPNTPTLDDPGGSSWSEGETHALTWTPASPEDPDGDPVTYEIQFSADGTFGDAVLLAEDLTGASYDWTLAATLVGSDTATCEVRLRARDNYEMVSAWSTSTAFTVNENQAPTISVVSPTAGSTTTDRQVPVIVGVADGDAGDKLHVRLELSESADYSIGVISPDTSVSQTGWESSPSPYSVWSAFPSGGCDPGDRVRFTPSTNLRYDLYYARARVTDLAGDGFTSAWSEWTFRVAPAPGSPVLVTVDATDYHVTELRVTEVSGGEASSLEFVIPSDVWADETKSTTVSCAVNIEGTARTWTGTLEDVQSSGAHVRCIALLDDAYLSYKLCTGDVVSKDIGQALADLVTSYGSPLTGAAIDTSTGISRAFTGAHKQLREHFQDALRELGSNWMLWVDATGDVHFENTADMSPPTYLLKES